MARMQAKGPSVKERMEAGKAAFAADKAPPPMPPKKGGKGAPPPFMKKDEKPGKGQGKKPKSKLY